MDLKIRFLGNLIGALCWVMILVARICIGSIVNTKQILPDFRASQMNRVDNQGKILLSENRNFVLSFAPTQDVTLFTLSIIHTGSSRTVWTANRNNLVLNSDDFVFSKDGNAFLESNGTTVWSTNTGGKGAKALELLDSGNLVVLGNDSRFLWQSFSHPTDTLLSGQNFTVGMELISSSGGANSSTGDDHLEIKSGDMILYVDFKTPQQYWSMQKDKRNTINAANGEIYSATLASNSWMLYDQTSALISQFIFSSDTNPNITWAAVLGNNGLVSFYNLENGDSGRPEPIAIPGGSCQTPEPCDPFYICYSASDKRCQCPTALSSGSDCMPGVVSPCSSNSSFNLLEIGDGLSYFANNFVSPVSKSNLAGCQASCQSNCSCLVLFFDKGSGNCFMFDQIGSLQQSDSSSTGYIAYIKVSDDGKNGSNSSQGGSSGGAPLPVIVGIVVSTVIVIAVLVYVGFRYIRKRKLPESPQGSSEDDTFLENLAGAPIRFSYRELQTATSNFSVKLGQGGFGSVYQGVLPDGSRIAVKKLESIGQGKKEFRAEVSIIGSIHHVHLVRLRGFCAEGTHRLLAYEFMANGSLDRWIFRNNRDGFMLDWNKRFNIALATAKGLAYLHEDCNVKIVHCDIKPENVLLDDNFLAKVSDFGLAKLMTREQSHVFTTLRGTRGYLAPEWITNYAISEKSDVYSFGMVLLEIIGGRKNFDPAESSEKAHFPSYAFKKMEEGKLEEILDSKLDYDERDERFFNAIKVALWCIQEDMPLRPSMNKVVQMLEGISDIPRPPVSTQIGYRLYSNFSKSGTSSDPSDCNSDALLSAVRLSGPR